MKILLIRTLKVFKINNQIKFIIKMHYNQLIIVFKMMIPLKKCKINAFKLIKLQNKTIKHFYNINLRILFPIICNLFKKKMKT